jgi:hypothetical protein
VTRHSKIKMTKFMMTLKSGISCAPAYPSLHSLVSFSILLRFDLDD